MEIKKPPFMLSFEPLTWLGFSREALPKQLRPSLIKKDGPLPIL